MKGTLSIKSILPVSCISCVSWFSPFRSMGLDINAVQFLIGAQKRGVRFTEVLMVGRQDLNVYPAKMAKVLERAGLPFEAFKTGDKTTQYAEPLFRSLGAKSVFSLDASDFE